ncbi:MAG: tetratricopeptide repeat protein [Bacteroidota bacterium]
MTEDQGPFEENEFLGNSLKKFEEMRRRKTQYFFDVDTLLNLIDHYLEILDFDSADEVTKYARSIHPDSSSFIMKEAELFALAGKKEKALALLEKVERVSPFDPEVFVIKGNIYSILQIYDSAISSYKKALSLADEQKDDIYFRIGIAYQSLGNFNAAIDFYRDCLKDNPQHEACLSEVVSCCEFGDIFEQGINLINSIIDEDPYHYLSWYHLGELYTKQGNFEYALKAFDYCLLINDQFAPAYLDLAQVYLMNDQFEEAILAYKTAFEYCHPDAYTYYNLGECYEQLKKWDEARDYYYKAIKSDPFMAQAWYGIGVTYEEEERWYEAMYYIKKAIENEEGNGEYWLALGDCEFQLGNFQEADECYNKSISLDPENIDTWLAYGDLLHNINLNQRAAALMAQGVAYHPTVVELYYRLSAYLFLIGKTEASMIELEGALHLDYNQHRIVFEIAPAMANDERTNWIINTNKKS